jgi:hypothetical protein
MVELNHAVKNVDGVNTLIKASHGVVSSIHIMHDQPTGTLKLRNGTDVSAPLEFTIHTEHTQNYIDINRRFENGIFAEVDHTNVYALIVYK